MSGEATHNNTGDVPLGDATHSNTGDVPLGEATHSNTGYVPLVYLAGPMVFEPNPVVTFDRMKAICREYGLEGVAPLDNQIGLEILPLGRQLLERIVRADIGLMRTVQAGLFCLDGFRRGPEMDPGTAFEVGYMAALGKKLAGWSRDARPYPDKVADFFRDTYDASLVSAAPAATGGTSGSLRDPDGMLVHSDGCLQNAMIHIGIELAGGGVFADADWELAFAQGLVSIRKQLGL